MAVGGGMEVLCSVPDLCGSANPKQGEKINKGNCNMVSSVCQYAPYVSAIVAALWTSPITCRAEATCSQEGCTVCLR